MKEDSPSASFGNWMKHFLHVEETNNGFQLCPKCNGDGNLGRYNSPNVYSEVPICDVCEGKKIISTVTGQPPQ